MKKLKTAILDILDDHLDDGEKKGKIFSHICNKLDHHIVDYNETMEISAQVIKDHQDLEGLGNELQYEMMRKIGDRILEDETYEFISDNYPYPYNKLLHVKLKVFSSKS